MEVIASGVVAGVLGTMFMDSMNHFVSGTGLISKIDVAMIGRMAVGWARGRFRYQNPGEMQPVSNEKFFGYLAHFTIGIGLAVPFVLAWNLVFGTPPSPAMTLVYGVATTAASWFIVFPSMGFGAFGRRSPDGIKAALSSLVNHLFYGAGMAVAIALLGAA